MTNILQNRGLAASIEKNGKPLHMKCLLHDNRISAFEKMPVIRRIAEAVHRSIQISGTMKHR
jgi:hypothetical protein